MTAGPCASMAKIELIINDERHHSPRRSEAEPHWVHGTALARLGILNHIVAARHPERCRSSWPLALPVDWPLAFTVESAGKWRRAVLARVTSGAGEDAARAGGPGC